MTIIRENFFFESPEVQGQNFPLPLRKLQLMTVSTRDFLTRLEPLKQAQ